MNRIVVGGKVKKVILAEGVVETEKTIEAAKKKINELMDRYYPGLPYPEFHTAALVRKSLTFEEAMEEQDITAAYWIDPRIWIHGWGCDNGEIGRSLKKIMGVLSPHAKSAPLPPYYRPLF